MIADDLLALATPIERLELLPGNPRRGDLQAVARSLARFGQRKPIVARRDGTVIAGNHTLQAARSLAWDHIAVVWVDDDEATAQAFALADNRTAELGGYDEHALLELIESVQAVDEALLADTGWLPEAVTDLQASLAQAVSSTLGAGNGETESAEVPNLPSVPVTRPADTWLLGPHKLVCGDCRDHSVIADLLGEATVNIAFTSPPYASQRKYDETSGFRPIPPDEYTDWFEAVQAGVRTHLAEDGSWFVNIKEHTEDGQRHLYVKDLTIAHVRRWGWRFVDELCWVDSANGFPGGYIDRFKNAWEPVFHFSAAKNIKFNPMANAFSSKGAFTYSTESRFAMRSSGYEEKTEKQTHEGFVRPSNVIHIAAGGNRDVKHSAAFPTALPAWFIRAYSNPGEVVFDPFMGSGTTLIAAHREGRIAYGTEISPAYCDVICRRYQQATGEVPILASTGEKHDFLAET